MTIKDDFLCDAEACTAIALNYYKHMKEEKERISCKEILPIIIGKNSFNKVITADLFKLPHLLIAGAGGQGKTVCLISIIASLLCKKQSSELKFVFIDPKRIELFPFNKLNKSFIAQANGEFDNVVITDPETAKRTLDSLNEEKDKRYMLLYKANVKSIVEYNDKYSKELIGSDDGHTRMPYIVIAIDEIADLIYMLGEEFEHSLYEIATLGRAVGIHLVLSTQRPSEDVITGRLKANLPAKIAFKMLEEADSIRVIDCEDAAYLNSCGDMLFSDSNSITRLKGALIDTHELEEIIESANARQMDSQPYFLPDIDENKY